MGIADANSAGNVHGGTVMKLCDEAAGLAAIKHSRSRVVTVANVFSTVPSFRATSHAVAALICAPPDCCHSI